MRARSLLLLLPGLALTHSQKRFALFSSKVQLAVSVGGERDEEDGKERRKRRQRGKSNSVVAAAAVATAEVNVSLEELNELGRTHACCNTTARGGSKPSRSCLRLLYMYCSIILLTSTTTEAAGERERGRARLLRRRSENVERGRLRPGKCRFDGGKVNSMDK